MPTEPLVLGHRGASRAAPENTLEAFTRAAAMGADGVELDVRRSADGVLVVHHDPSIDGFGLIAGSPFEVLRTQRPEVPTLAESLAATGSMFVNVEVKCLPWEEDADPEHGVVAKVVDEVRAHLERESGSRVVVSSFDLGAVDACRRFAPELVTGWLVMDQDVATVAPIAADRGHAWLHPNRASVLATPAGVAACHALGLLVNVWTVDEPDDIRTLAALEVDGIITNVPDLALAVLGEIAR